MSTPKRHHYLPRFYLDGFADEKHRIRVYRRDGSEPYVTGLTNVAVQSRFYEHSSQGEGNEDVEQSLSRIESLAAPAWRRLSEGSFPPSDDDRHAIAKFVATLITRSPENRDLPKAMYSNLRAFLANKEDMGQTEIDEVMERSGIEEPTDGMSIDLLLPLADRLIPRILDKSWLLRRCRNATFVTSDRPVVSHRNDDELNQFMGVGIANADEVYIPVDRHSVLMMVPTGSLSEIVVLVEKEEALFVNSIVADLSYEWVFQHPDDPFLGTVMPDSARPLFWINDRDVYGR